MNMPPSPPFLCTHTHTHTHDRYKYSRASYLAGLLRPAVIEELELERHGLKYIPRDPSSFTPTLVDGPHGGKSLILGSDEKATHASIAQFSAKDADAYFEYEEFLSEARALVSPLLDAAPPDPTSGRASERARTARVMADIASACFRHRGALIPFYELFTAPADRILNRWFESDLLKATLACDAVIGALTSPSQPGSAYVLLHHVMGEAAGRPGVWAYVEGGMGRVSDAAASAAREAGAELCVGVDVNEILTQQGAGSGAATRADGVRLSDGTKLRARRAVMANCTPYHAFVELLPNTPTQSSPHDASELERFTHHIQTSDYACGALKINCALDRLPEFACMASDPAGIPGPQHRGTIHLQNSIGDIEAAYRDAAQGRPASRPVIELTIPSSLDATVAPPGGHVAQLFVQYAPYAIDESVGSWADPDFARSYADQVCAAVDEFVPGFSDSILHRDVLTPLDLERIFGLHRGNIFHGAISLHQLAYARPAPGYSSYRTPIEGLYLCSAGTHPGGGVMGAAGRNSAFNVLSDIGLGSVFA